MQAADFLAWLREEMIGWPEVPACLVVLPGGCTEIGWNTCA